MVFFCLKVDLRTFIRDIHVRVPLKYQSYRICHCKLLKARKFILASQGNIGKKSANVPHHSHQRRHYASDIFSKSFLPTLLFCYCVSVSRVCGFPCTVRQGGIEVLCQQLGSDKQVHWQPREPLSCNVYYSFSFNPCQGRLASRHALLPAIAVAFRSSTASHVGMRIILSAYHGWM
jgi:hypothetical protein